VHGVLVGKRFLFRALNPLKPLRSSSLDEGADERNTARSCTGGITI
jgi:hypothetical protein